MTEVLFSIIVKGKYLDGVMLVCPICHKRKAKRFCPAKAQTICSVCCGTEREVTIDCPSDCPYLLASRQHDLERREIDWSKVPFPDKKIERPFVAAHDKLLAALCHAICLYARDNPALVDTDVQVSLEFLAKTYQTLTSGIYYENLPDSFLQRGLYEALQASLDDYQKAETQQIGLSSTRNAEIRDALILLAQVAVIHSNGRAKGRAYLDFLRAQFTFGELSKPSSSLLVVP